ncbi:MAG TPA: hypothetical protein VEK37_05030 [Gemmatimonadaceae bacterium]|nr:hypothetical protein [Gemmatimonadaceae bacterium]
MVRRNVAGLLAVFVGAVALVACSDQTPVSPKVNSAAPADLRVVASGATGSYQLSFYTNGLVPVSSLTVFQELILGAHVADASGAPAQGGSVTFQYCSLKGLPSNDINRPDEAPSAECATRAASWANLISVPVDGSGNAYMNFGFVSIPRTVGFRFKYNGQGSGIANGTSTPSDFTWVPIP